MVVQRNNVPKKKQQAVEQSIPKLGKVRMEVSYAYVCVLIMVKPERTELDLGNFYFVQHGVYLLNS